MSALRSASATCVTQQTPPSAPDSKPYRLDIVWRNVAIMGVLHVAMVYGVYLWLARSMWTTFIYTFVLAHVAGLGITAGAHRLWTHRSYKARLPLQLILLFLNSMSLQNSVVVWARDHRMHHKYSDTDADPHNSRRGFFFAHIGWLLVRKHPEIMAKGHTVEMADLNDDPLLQFQKKYYIPLALLSCFYLPSYIPTLWGESFWVSFFVCGVGRYVVNLNNTWLVNSAAHLWGDVRPYDASIRPVETRTVSALALGEGFHNYHHTFPWDYKTAELGDYSLNLSKLFIDIMASIGWAYDLKVAPREMVHARAARTGHHRDTAADINTHS